MIGFVHSKDLCQSFWNVAFLQFMNYLFYKMFYITLNVSKFSVKNININQSFNIKKDDIICRELRFCRKYFSITTVEIQHWNFIS